MECEDDNGSISVLKGGIVWRFFFFNLGPKECRRIEPVSVLLECSQRIERACQCDVTVITVEGYKF
jgi:hypothetical protein